MTALGRYEAAVADEARGAKLEAPTWFDIARELQAAACDADAAWHELRGVGDKLRDRSDDAVRRGWIAFAFAARRCSSCGVVQPPAGPGQHRPGCDRAA